MPTNNTDSQIRARIDAFVAELTDLVRAAALEHVQDALAGAGLTAPARRGPGRPRKKAAKKAARKTARKTGKRVRRSAADLAEAGQAILLVVKDNPGIQAAAIRKALGVDAKDLKRPINMLLAAKKLRTEGQKRGTRYFAGAGRNKAAKKRKRA